MTIRLTSDSWEDVRRLQDLPLTVACSSSQVFSGGVVGGTLGADEHDDDLGSSVGSGRPKANLAGIWTMMFESTYQTNDLLFIATREALQNSRDAIVAAVRKGEIGKTQGEFSVELDTDARSITWTDNGIGMDLKTIDEVFLSLSSSKKEAGAAGGFGAAKAVILGISEDFHWRLESQAWVVVSHGFDKDISYYRVDGRASDAPLTRDENGLLAQGPPPDRHHPKYRQGVRLTIYDIYDKYLWYPGVAQWEGRAGDPLAIQKRLLGANEFLGFYPGASRSNIRLLLNGKKVSPLFKRNRGTTLRLVDETGEAGWGRRVEGRARAYRRKHTGGSYFVRLDGLIQFIQPARNKEVKVDVTVDLSIDPSLTPKDPKYPLPVSRDSIKSSYQAGRMFSALQEEIETDTQSGGRETDYESYYPESVSSEADKLAEEMEEGVDQALIDQLQEIEPTDIRSGPAIRKKDVTSDDDAVVQDIREFIEKGKKLNEADNTKILEVDPEDKSVNPRLLTDLLERYNNRRGIEALWYADYFVQAREGRKLEHVPEEDYADYERRFVQAFKEAQADAAAAVRTADPTEQKIAAAEDILDRVSQGEELTADGAELLDKAIEAAAESEMGPDGQGLVGAIGAVHASQSVGDLLSPYEQQRRLQRPNPFGKLAALKINLNNYNTRKANSFKRNFAKYVPWLILLDRSIRAVAKAGGYWGGTVFPGFVLDEEVVALAEKPDKIGTDRYIYINPDDLGDLINPRPVFGEGKRRKRPKADPFLIAAFLNGIVCHELTHLRGHNRHDEAFVVAREALGRESAKTIPLMAQFTADLLRIPTSTVSRQEYVALQKSETKLKKKVARLRAKLAAAAKKAPCPHAPTPSPSLPGVPLEQKAAEFWDRIVAESQRTQEGRAGEANLQDVDDSFFVYAGHSTAQQVAQALIQDLGADARLEAAKLTGPMEAQALREYVVARFLGGDGSEFGDMAPGGGSAWIRAWDQHVARMPASLRKDWILDEEENRTAPAGSPYAPWDHPWT